MDLGPYSFSLLGRARGVISLAQAREKPSAGIEVTPVPDDAPIPANGARQVSYAGMLQPLAVAKLTDGCASHLGACVTRDGFLIEEISQHLDNPIATHRHLHSLRVLQRIRRIDGAVVVLASPCQYNYYHWMLEVLPKLDLFRRGASVPEDARFYVETHQRFQAESLRMLGIERTINSRENRVIRAEALFAATIPRPSGAPHPWAVDWLRRTVLPLARRETGEASPIRCLFVSRRHAKNRRLVNEAELLARLAPLQPVVAMLETLSVAEQLDLFSRAELIIATHGAGLANLAFARAGSRVLEIFASQYHNPCYQRLAEAAGCGYTALTCESVPDPVTMEPNIRVDLEAVDVVVRG